MRYRFTVAGMTFAVLAALVGCGTSPPARLYTLCPIPPQEKPATPPTAVSVSVAPVELPDYLDRSQIVTRDGGNGLKIAEFDRWGGSLGENVTTVLVENLSELLVSDRVVLYPGLSAAAPDFRVGVRILRLDAVPGERVELKAQWLVTTGAEKAEVARGLSTFTERVNGGSYDHLVAAINCSIEQLSREIAGKIAAAPPVTLSGPSPEGH